jgi:hypothetical protein
MVADQMLVVLLEEQENHMVLDAETPQEAVEGLRTVLEAVVAVHTDQEQIHNQEMDLLAVKVQETHMVLDLMDGMVVEVEVLMVETVMVLLMVVVDLVL